MATSTLPTGGMIDPTKQAEYPVLLGDRLAVKDSTSKSQLININYNHKTKSSQQRQSTITRSSQSPDFYNLSITDKTENNTLAHLYEGSVDPTQEAQESEVRDYVLVFDSDRKAFVLEPVATQLNFNLRSAPAKTGKQVIKQYEQLRTLQDDLQSSGDDLATDGIAEEDDDGAADESNPYDFRHFLPKAEDEENKPATDHATPEPLPTASKSDVPPSSATTKPAPSPKPRSDPQSNPPRPKKTEPAKKKTEPSKKPEPAKKEEPTKKKEPPPAKPSPEPEPRVEMEEVEGFPESKSSPSDTGTAALSSHKAVPSPGSNIIVDGDLIIDMGSPPPSRPAFKVNPAHFSSNHTPNGAEEEEDDEDEEMEDLRLPSPARQAEQSAPVEKQENPSPAEEEVEEDALAAEMEAAFEESAREEENARTQPYQQPPSRAYNAPSDDESEVSEEE